MFDSRSTSLLYSTVQYSTVQYTVWNGLVRVLFLLILRGTVGR